MNYNTQNSNIKLILILIVLIILLILIYRIYNLPIFETFNTTKVNNEPKIAFLFLTYNNLKRPDIWNKFFGIDINNGSSGNGINTSEYANKFTIYNHAKEPENVTDVLLKDKHIPEHIETCWGCFGTVEANILMMKEALKDSLNTKFILVSDSCIPIVSFDKLYNILMTDDKSRFKFWKENNTKYRYNDIIEPEFSIDEFIKHNAQGLIFNKNHTELLVNSLLKYKNNWKKIGCVDEHYFGNILKLLDKNFNLNNNSKNSMFNCWFKDELNINNICKDNNYDTICESHHIGSKSSALFKNIFNNTIDEIRNKEFLFIRKVDNDTNIDINYIFT